MDEFFIDKLTKESKTKNLKRLTFNSYGNEFLSIDDQGNLFVFSFEHDNNIKLPKITLWNTPTKSCKDAVFLNNSGVIASTFGIDTQRNTTLWDFLLPLNQANVGDINIGGNLINSIGSEASLIVCNDKPGYISYIDMRRMSVVTSFQAHLDEIKSIKVSERENFLITCGKGKQSF